MDGVVFVLRGTAVSDPAFSPSGTYTCARCVVRAAAKYDRQAAKGSVTAIRQLTYDETLSTVIDHLVGIELRPPSSPSPPYRCMLLTLLSNVGRQT